jgi:hypothetical protein
MRSVLKTEQQHTFLADITLLEHVVFVPNSEQGGNFLARIPNMQPGSACFRASSLRGGGPCGWRNRTVSRNLQIGYPSGNDIRSPLVGWPLRYRRHRNLNGCTDIGSGARGGFSISAVVFFF